MSASALILQSVCGTNTGQSPVSLEWLEPYPGPDQHVLRGRWWVRTTDIRLVRARQPNPSTCTDARKGTPEQRLSVLNVAHRFATFRVRSRDKCGTTRNH